MVKNHSSIPKILVQIVVHSVGFFTFKHIQKSARMCKEEENAHLVYKVLTSEFSVE
jgi:hypothetical protein